MIFKFCLIIKCPFPFWLAFKEKTEQGLLKTKWSGYTTVLYTVNGPRWADGRVCLLLVGYLVLWNFIDGYLYIFSFLPIPLVFSNERGTSCNIHTLLTYSASFHFPVYFPTALSTHKLRMVPRRSTWPARRVIWKSSNTWLRIAGQIRASEPMTGWRLCMLLPRWATTRLSSGWYVMTQWLNKWLSTGCIDFFWLSCLMHCGSFFE